MKRTHEGRLAMKRILALTVPLLVPLAGLYAAAVPPVKPNILFAMADDWSYGTPELTVPMGQDARRSTAWPATGCSSLTPTRRAASARRRGRASSRAATPGNSRRRPTTSVTFRRSSRRYAEALAEHGYFVGMTGKGWAPGVATNAAGKPRQMAGQPFDRRRATPPTRKSAATTTRRTSRTFSTPRRRTSRGVSGMAATSRIVPTSSARASPKAARNYRH